MPAVCKMVRKMGLSSFLRKKIVMFPMSDWGAMAAALLLASYCRPEIQCHSRTTYIMRRHSDERMNIGSGQRC